MWRRVTGGQKCQRYEAPRVLGIECVGTVVEAPGGGFEPGQRVCAMMGGMVCMTGILGGQWELQEFRPMGHIPTGVRLSSYSGGATDITNDELQRYVSSVQSGELPIHRGPVWRFDQLQEAHRTMDENSANGKIVVVV